MVGTRSVKTPSTIARSAAPVAAAWNDASARVQRVEIVVALVVARRLGGCLQPAEVQVAPEIVDVQHRRRHAVRGARRRERRRELGLAAAVEPIDGDDSTARRRGRRHTGGRMRQSGVNSWISAAPAREIATMSSSSSTIGS